MARGYQTPEAPPRSAKAVRIRAALIVNAVAALFLLLPGEAWALIYCGLDQQD